MAEIDDALLHTTMKLMASREQGYRRQDLYRAVAETYPVPEEYQRLSRETPGRERTKWQMVVGWGLSDPLKLAGWVENRSGYWIVTPEGRDALERHADPVDFAREARRLAREARS